MRAQVCGGKAHAPADPAAALDRAEDRVYSRPSIFVAVAKSPSSTARRMAVLLMISPSEVTGSTPTTRKSSSAPSFCKSARLPARFLPNDHSWPTQISRSGRAAAASCLTNSSGGVPANSRSNLSTSKCDTPRCANQLDFVLRRREQAWAFLWPEDFRRVRIEGHDHRGSTQLASASRAAVEITAWCPRWTPSKTPIARKSGPGSCASSAMEFRTRITVGSSPAPAL